MTTNKYYSGMLPLLFAEEVVMQKELGRDGWRKATGHTWFRLVDDFIEFLTTSVDRDNPGQFRVVYRNVRRLEQDVKKAVKAKPVPPRDPLSEVEPAKRKEVEVVHVKRRTICF
jgi:hypothetical protein